MDLALAKAERLKLNRRIIALERTVFSLASLVEQPTIDPAKGITEGIKAALESVSPGGLYPRTLRLELEQAGFDFSEQKNPMASIHAILKRLKGHHLAHTRDLAQGTAYYFGKDDGRPVFDAGRWIGPNGPIEELDGVEDAEGEDE
jgi:hypothetical protein